MGSLGGGVRDEGRCVKIKRRCAARVVQVRRGYAGRAAPLRRCPTPAASAAPSCSGRTGNPKRSVPSHCYLITLSSHELFIHSMTCCFLYDRPTIRWFLVSYRENIRYVLNDVLFLACSAEFVNNFGVTQNTQSCSEFQDITIILPRWNVPIPNGSTHISR